jgi:hypothetical protein
MPAPKGNNFAAGNKGGGRKTNYKPEYAKIAAKMCHLGATDADLAEAFGVSVATIGNWKGQHEEFSSALKADKALADERVERSLYQRALGYACDEVDIRVVNGEIVQTPLVKQYPPDTTAAIFWLKNRKSADWRDKQDVDVTTAGESLNAATDRDRAKAILALVQKASKGDN